MINLIKNELTKIFHKKSIYIMIIIMVLFTILGIFGNLIINYDLLNSIENYAYDYELKTFEEELNNYDLTNETERSNYIVVKTEYIAIKERMKFKERYKKDYVDNYVYDFIHCEVENEVNGLKAEAEECKKNHEALIEEIKNNDWKHFVEKDIKEDEKKIAEAELLGLSDTVIAYKNDKKACEYQLKYNISPTDNRINIIDTYQSYKNMYDSYSLKEKVLKDEDKKLFMNAKEQYKIAEYKLENNLLYDDYGTLMTLNSTFKSAGFFVIITIALIAGSVVSDEFNKGTIKQLLIRPHTRSKILLSKLLSVLIVFVMVLAFHYLLNLIMNLITGNPGELLMPIIKYNYNTDTIYKQSILLSLIFGTLKILPCYLMILLFSFLASTVTKIDALGILAGIGLYFGGNILNAILSLRDLWINKIIPTMCWDLNAYLTSYNSLTSIILPLIVDIITIAIMIVIAFIVFKKTDIKNQ